MDPDYPNGLVRNFHRLSGRHCQEEFDPTFAPTGNSSNSMCREAGAVQGGEQKKEVQVVQYKEGSSTFKLLLQTNRQVDRSEPGLNPSTPRSSPENEIGLLGSV